jgi:hypothetical protein
VLLLAACLSEALQLKRALPVSTGFDKVRSFL